MPKANIDGLSKAQLVRQFKAEHPGLGSSDIARQMTTKYGTTFSQGTVSGALGYKFKGKAKPVEPAKKSRFQMVREFVAANPGITALKDISAAASKEYGVSISGPLVWQALNRGPGTKRKRKAGLATTTTTSTFAPVRKNRKKRKYTRRAVANGHVDNPVAEMISASKFVKAVGIDRAKALVDLMGKLFKA